MSSDATRIFAAELTRLMERKDWAAALRLAEGAPALLDEARLGWTLKHIRRCVELPETARLDALACPRAARQRLREVYPQAELRSVTALEGGMICLAGLHLVAHDASTGKRLELYEKIYPPHRMAQFHQECALFEAVDHRRLLAPRQHGALPHRAHLSIFYDFVRGRPLAGPARARLDEIRMQHWQARLEGALAEHRLKRAALIRGFRKKTLARVHEAAANPGDAAAAAAVHSRFDELARIIHAAPRFVMHEDLKPENVLEQAPANRLLRMLRGTQYHVVDWEKWHAAPIGSGLRLTPQGFDTMIATPRAQARLAAQHPQLPLLIALFNAADRMAKGQLGEAGTWMPRVLRASESVPPAR